MRVRTRRGSMTLLVAPFVYACGDTTRIFPATTTGATPATGRQRGCRRLGDDAQAGDGAPPGSGIASLDASGDAPDGEDEDTEVWDPPVARWARSLPVRSLVHGVGAPPRQVTPVDFRFYVHDVRVVDDGRRVTQARPVAARRRRLIDFEDRKARADGDAIVNDVIVGSLPEGDRLEA